MWAFEQIYTGNKYFSLSAIFCMYFWVRGRHHCCVFDIQEIRRRQQEEAALKRQQQADGRGVKDPERLKRQQKRREDAEREALRHGPSDGGLKWTVG